MRRARRPPRGKAPSGPSAGRGWPPCAATASGSPSPGPRRRGATRRARPPAPGTRGALPRCRPAREEGGDRPCRRSGSAPSWRAREERKASGSAAIRPGRPTAGPAGTGWRTLWDPRRCERCRKEPAASARPRTPSPSCRCPSRQAARERRGRNPAPVEGMDRGERQVGIRPARRRTSGPVRCPRSLAEPGRTAATSEPDPDLSPPGQDRCRRTRRGWSSPPPRREERLWWRRRSRRWNRHREPCPPGGPARGRPGLARRPRCIPAIWRAPGAECDRHPWPHGQARSTGPNPGIRRSSTAPRRWCRESATGDCPDRPLPRFPISGPGKNPRRRDSSSRRASRAPCAAGFPGRDPFRAGPRAARRSDRLGRGPFPRETRRGRAR